MGSLCTVMGICLEQSDPTPVPTIAPTRPPTQAPTNDYDNAPWPYKVFFWKTGVVLQTQPWHNSLNAFLFCRIFGTCYPPPPEVAETLPAWGSPFWSDRLCNVTYICPPTVAPTNEPSPRPTPEPTLAPTISPEPTTDPRPWPVVAEPAPTPPPDVALFGGREPGQPFYCRFSRSC